MRQEKIKKGLTFLLALALILGVIAVPPEKAGAYNFPWDQGHDCVNTVNADGTWGRWNYNKKFIGAYESKECCELYCKICPVYANTGQLQESYTDLSVPGLGPALSITRTYNSQDLSTSLLGHSWTFNFGRRLIIGRKKSGEKVIGVLQETGEKNFFNEDANGAITLLSGYGVTYSLIKNANGTYIIKELDGTVRQLNADGKISKIADKNGNTLTFTYDAVGCLSKITNASGNYVNIQLGANGKIASISDNLGRTVNYSYDQNGDLASFQDPLGNTTQYAYDNKHRLTKITDPRGNVVLTAAYNSDNKVSTFMEKGETYTIAYYTDYTQKKDSKGNTWTYYFNNVGVIQKVIDPLGNVKEQQLNKVTATSVDWEKDLNGNKTTYTYDGNGNITSKIDPLGNTTAYTYVPGTNLVAMETDPLGVVAKYEYDAKGNRTKVIKDFGGTLQNVTTYTYDSKGNQTGVTDPLGHTTSYEYDANGNLIKETDSLGYSTNYTYDSLGNRLTETDANSNTTIYSYDMLGQMTSLTNANGNKISFTYDANGNLGTVQDADGNLTIFTYDAYNRLLQEKDPIGNTKDYAYDNYGNIVSEIDSKGNISTYNYDKLNRKIEKTNSLGNKTKSTYDAVGNLTSVIDSNGNSVQFSYDANNRLVKETYPEGKSETYSYDALGNMISKTNADGNTITFTYDSLNRVTARIYPDGSKTQFTFDPLNRILAGSNNNSNLTYKYDDVGRATHFILNGRTINYFYDNVGNRITMTTPEGEKIAYVYNKIGRMTQLKLSNGQGITYAYDSLDRVIKKTFSGGTYTTYGYNLDSKVTQIRHLRSDNSEIYTQVNTYDRVGNLISKDTDLGITSYSYDNLYQLISANYPGQPQELFSYDGVGNRLTSAEYDNWNYNSRNQILNYNGTTFKYDSNGNTIEKIDVLGTTKFAYDYDNRLIKIDFPDGRVATYKYDIWGRRIEKKDNGNITQYLYDNYYLLAEYDYKGDLLRNYYNGYGDYNPSILYENNTIYFPHYDHLNTPQQVSDASGITCWEAAYKSYGDTNIKIGNIINNFRFPGMYYDAESGLFYNWNRYYDPSIGRYISSDPIGIQRGRNLLYVYVNNSPINNIDTDGKSVKTTGCSASDIPKIQAAAAKADAASQTCLPCIKGHEDRPDFRKHIRNLTVKCVPWNINPRTGNSICGFMSGSYEIEITPQGLSEVPGCGCLQATILHEVTHQIGFTHSGDRNAFAAEGKCFKCSTEWGNY